MTRYGELRSDNVFLCASKFPQRTNRRTAWTLRLPLIERLRDAVWAAVLRLKGEHMQAPGA